MKKKLFNALTYTLLGVSLLSMAYVLVPEFQELVPDLGVPTAVIVAIGTFFMSGGYVLVSAFIKKEQNKFDNLSNILAEKFLEMANHYKELTKKLEENDRTNKELVKLEKIQLKTKLDNPLITKSAKELIEGVLDDKKKPL